jgi:hypothetical protein
MSNSLAIAAVTATLRNLLQQGLDADVDGATVTSRPLDRARDNVNGGQVNLFLYHAAVSAAWRNLDIPWKVKPGETGHPPLPLDLYYLVTAYYGETEEQVDSITNANRLLGSHRLLGRAMSVLHDHPLLDIADIQSVLPPDDQLEHPYDQVERVRITPQPLSLDELSKLWTGFQTQYRLSAAYQVSVVLIESAHPARTPLPVLTRGPADRGAVAQADLTPPFPTLTSVRLPNDQPNGHLGDNLTLSGHHLEGDSLVVNFRHALLEDPIPIPVTGGTAMEIAVQLPNDPAQWPAGFYTLSAVISLAGQPDRTTNELSLSLAPQIQSIAPNPATPDANGDVALTLTCTPQVRPDQHAALLLGDREIPAQPRPALTDTLDFDVVNAVSGDFFVRLRVDGVDSLLIDRTVMPPVFDATQKVTIS